MAKKTSNKRSLGPAPKMRGKTLLAPEMRALEKGSINLGEMLSSEATEKAFQIWLVGETPLIVHAWSQKAKIEMLQKQTKATKSGKVARDPHSDFVSSLYEMGEAKNGQQVYGFPVTGLKNAILSSAHKDKGIARTGVQSTLWLDADMVRVLPAHGAAVCDMPLVRVYADPPEMREDMVRIGKGLNKTANLAYRAQFKHWAIHLTGRFNEEILPPDVLLFLLREAGRGVGIGEWRNEKKGMFGAFSIASMAEQRAWEKFAAGKGPLPLRKDDPEYVDLQAAE